MNECITTPQHEKQIGYWVSDLIIIIVVVVIITQNLTQRISKPLTVNFFKVVKGQ